MQLTNYHAKYFAHELTRRFPPDSAEKLAGAVASAQVDLNPHQVDAALFAFRSPLSRGALLADEVGLGKTIVDGGRSWTYSPAHPRVRPPFGSTNDLLKLTQRSRLSLGSIQLVAGRRIQHHPDGPGRGAVLGGNTDGADANQRRRRSAARTAGKCTSPSASTRCSTTCCKRPTRS